MSMLAKALPFIATTLGGPLAGLAVEILAPKLGISEPTVEKVKQTLSGLPPEEIAKLTLAENELKIRLAQLGYDSVQKLEELALRAAEAVNKTMQSEAIAEKWPQYSWRPFIGFAFGFNLIQVSLTASVCYIAAIFFGKADYLVRLPKFITAITALNATTMPILGVAAWFRGKMQADPNIPPLPKWTKHGNQTS